MVTMLPATGNSFKVYIVNAEESAAYISESEKPKTSLNLIIVSALVLIILIASICLIRKHNRKSKKKK